MIIPLTDLDTLKNEKFTEAGFLFTDPEELRNALIETIHTSTGHKSEILLQQENANNYKLDIFSGREINNYLFENNIMIGKNQMSMRIRLKTGEIPEMYTLAKNFTNYVMDKIHNT